MFDPIRLWWAQMVFRFHLERLGMPAKPYREAVIELRGNLTDAAEAHGAKQAIANVGGIQQLAENTAAAYDADRNPCWAVGLGWVFAVFVAIVVIGMVRIFGFLDGMTAATDQYVAPVPCYTSAVKCFANDGAYPVGITVGWSWPTVAIMLVAYLVGARIWRLLPDAAVKRSKSPWEHTQ